MNTKNTGDKYYREYLPPVLGFMSLACQAKTTVYLILLLSSRFLKAKLELRQDIESNRVIALDSRSA